MKRRYYKLLKSDTNAFAFYFCVSYTGTLLVNETTRLITLNYSEHVPPGAMEINRAEFEMTYKSIIGNFDKHLSE